MKVTAVGMMSGTSLDGVDLALCRFTQLNGEWEYEILDAKTYEYSEEWTVKLKNAPLLKVAEFLLLHNEYGRYIGNLVKDFLKGKITPELVCSHGHTIFHQPEKGFTFQLGNGASVAASCSISTVSDFRTLDVALGGQGAPLVPIGDKLLFKKYDYCVNLGGFANVSFDWNHRRIAYDICPVNIVLNYLAGEKGLSFDRNGEIGKRGKVNEYLLRELNSLDYYSQGWPKSLGREWTEQKIIPILQHSGLSLEDQAATIYEHISIQISNIPGISGKILFTGGGTHNAFLITKLKERLNGDLVIPEENLINFKEALIFAFLGVLAYSKQVNCLSSVTGAKHDSISGTQFSILRNFV